MKPRAEAAKTKRKSPSSGAAPTASILGEVMLEAGLVICSITLMTRKRIFWQAGMILGIAGRRNGGSRFSYPLTGASQRACRLASFSRYIS